jgi:hypothetical protein
MERLEAEAQAARRREDEAKAEHERLRKELEEARAEKEREKEEHERIRLAEIERIKTEQGASYNLHCLQYPTVLVVQTYYISRKRKKCYGKRNSCRRVNRVSLSIFERECSVQKEIETRKSLNATQFSQAG